MLALSHSAPRSSGRLPAPSAQATRSRRPVRPHVHDFARILAPSPRPSLRRPVLNLSQASDEELVARAGIEPGLADACFAELYRRYFPKVAAWCLRIAGDREEAADVAQDVFVRIHSRLGSFRGDSRFSTWLYQVTRSVALNRAEYQARRKAQSLDEENAPEVIDELPAISDEMEAAEIHARLREAVANDLTPIESRVLILHYVHGLTLARIGTMLQLTNKSGAKAYIVSGLRKLKGGFARREASPARRSSS